MDTIEGMRSYSDVTSTDFNTRSYFNIFLNITIIILFSICISFSYRIYYNGIYNKGKRLCGIKNKSAKFKSITK